MHRRTFAKVAGCVTAGAIGVDAVATSESVETHDPDRVATAISRSVDRHGEGREGITEALKTRARARFEDRHRRR